MKKTKEDLLEFVENLMENQKVMFNEPLKDGEKDTSTIRTHDMERNYDSILRKKGSILDMFNLKFVYIGDAFYNENPKDIEHYQHELTFAPFREMERIINALAGPSKLSLSDLTLNTAPFKSVTLRSVYILSSDIVEDNNYQSEDVFQTIKEPKNIFGVGKIEKYLAALDKDLKEKVFNYNEGYKEINKEFQEKFKEDSLNIAKAESVLYLFLKNIDSYVNVKEYNAAINLLQDCLIKNKVFFVEEAFNSMNNIPSYDPDSYSYHLNQLRGL